MADPRFLNPITILADIGGVSIDITKRRNKTFDNIITQNPVEDGSPVTDHITNLPIKLSISGGFSDLSISNLVGPAITQQAWRGRGKTEFDKLLDLYTGKQVFRVMDGLHMIKDMQFKSLQETKEKEGFSVHFQAEIWQIQRVSAEDTDPDPLADLGDELDRKKCQVQMLLTVGAASTSASIHSIGILA